MNMYDSDFCQEQPYRNGIIIDTACEGNSSTNTHFPLIQGEKDERGRRAENQRRHRVQIAFSLTHCFERPYKLS